MDFCFFFRGGRMGGKKGCNFCLAMMDRIGSLDIYWNFVAVDF